MESLPDDLLLRIFTIGLVELGEPRLPVVVEDEDGLDHGWAGPTVWALRPGRGRAREPHLRELVAAASPPPPPAHVRALFLFLITTTNGAPM